MGRGAGTRVCEADPVLGCCIPSAAGPGHRPVSPSV